MPGCNRFFVYGTLRSHHGRHRHYFDGIITGHEMARLRGYQLYTWPPSILPANTMKASVLGDLYTIEEKAVPGLLGALDGLESYYPDEGFVRWVRTILPVEPLPGDSVPRRRVAAYVYLGGPGFPYDLQDLVPDGDWVRATQTINVRSAGRKKAKNNA